MSANVWFEEVNKGLIVEIKNTIKIIDATGFPVALSDDSIVVRKPEEDFKVEKYPCVSIYNLNYGHDPFRYNPSPVVVQRNVEQNTVTLEDSAVPFNLLYQLDLWAEYQTDMDYMTKTWLKKHFRQFNLPVIDDGGVKRECNCLMKGSVQKADLVLNGERLYHSIIKLLIWVELDDEMQYNKYIPSSTNLGIRQT